MGSTSEATKKTRIEEHIVEIVSDSGEGAQKAGQTFGTMCAKMGNGSWTVEIIPAEIKPPARSRAGASGNRIRFGSHPITNVGDEADFVVALNEQVLYSRIDADAYRKGTIILLENKWATDKQQDVVDNYNAALIDFKKLGYIVHEVPMEVECLKIMPNPRLGKNMFVVGMLCCVYSRNVGMAMDGIASIFAHKGEKVISVNQKLLQSGYDYAKNNIPYCFEVPGMPEQELIVTNGNQAVGLGVMAAGMDLVSMYPITPATSATHYMAAVMHQVGGFIHQAEDEIAAIGFAVGASYAGKTACTITSGPGMALKTEFIGLAVMAEIPLVIVNVQRGGPSTGLPTKVEQADLLSTLYGEPGDAPKIVMAAATIEECFHFVVTARQLAESFRTPVVVLTDTNLATGVVPFPKPVAKEEWLALPIDQSAWDKEMAPYEWNEETGVSTRPIPGQAGGEYVLTGLTHNKFSKVAYDPGSQQHGCALRSRKLSALQKTLKKPEVHGEEKGDLLVVGWGSTLGSIEEAVNMARAENIAVSSLHLRFISPLEPGLKEIFSRFKNVMTVEINYSDQLDMPNVTEESRRFSQLSLLLRAQTLVDIDCWSIVQGLPLAPKVILEVIKKQMTKLAKGE